MLVLDELLKTMPPFVLFDTPRVRPLLAVMVEVLEVSLPDRSRVKTLVPEAEAASIF